MTQSLDRRSFMKLAGLASLAANRRTWAAVGNQTVTSRGVNQFVNVFIGTGGHGHTFPGATVPLGMVQFSPDTGTVGWDHCSGFHHDDTSMIGFSHTHLSGTGIGDMLDVLIMPAVGSVRLDPGSP